MDPIEALISAYESLKANRLRAALTMLGVIIGVSMVIILVSLGEGAKAYVGLQMGGMGFGSNALVVHPGKLDPPIEPSKLSIQDSREIMRRIPEVMDQVPILIGSGTARFGKLEHKTGIWGLTENYPSLVNYRVLEGTFFSALEVEQHRSVCVVGQTIKRKLFSGLSPVGESIRLSGRKLQIIGLMEPKGEMLGINMDDCVIVPITTAQDILDTNRLTEIVVWAHNVDALPLVTTRLTDFLSSRHMDQDDFHFHTQEEMLSVLGNISGTLTLFVAGLAAVSLVVGCVGITNIMLVSVMERTREIGIRKAIGASQRDIFYQFFTEAMILSMSGGGLGILIGAAVSAVLLYWMGLPIEISRWAVAAALASSGAVGLTAGVYPAMQASKADPIKALRHE